MSLKDRILGADDPSTAIAAAMKAVEAAQAALESAYVNLLATARGLAVQQPAPTMGGQCDHPYDERLRADSFGGVQVFCGVCGEPVPE